MSTKIYNGFIFKENYSLLYLRDLATRFRNQIYPNVIKKVNTVIADMAIRRIDRNALFGDEYESCPLMDSIHAFEELVRKVKLTNCREPLVDMEFNVCIIPTKDKILGIAYSEQREFLDLWMAQEEVIDYPYWDNTDPPEDVSWEDWELRGKEWNEALKEHHGIPSMNGFSIEFVNHFSYGFPCAEDALSCAPTFEERKKYWIKELSLDYAEKRLGQEEASPWKRFNAAKEWLKTDDGKIYLEKTKALVEEKLPAIITREMLLARLGEVK